MLPLQGVLVVSVEQAVAAPLCTARLVEAGARVIKVERESGDFARFYDSAAEGESSYFTWLNQDKESIVLNYKEQDDYELLHRMISRADIFVQNLTPGAMERAGFGAKQLREKHPRLITCDISGYGESAELQHMKAYDLLVQCESGLVDISGAPQAHGRIGVSVADIGTGMAAHAGILEALIKRGVTGKGSGVKISLFDVMAEWMTVPLLHAEYGEGAPTRQGLNHPSIAPYGAYETADNQKTVFSIQNEREWLRLCAEVFYTPELARQEKLNNNNERVKNRNFLNSKISPIISTMTAKEFRKRLAKASIAFGAVNTVDDLSKHTALRRISVKTSQGKTVDIPAPPMRTENTKERETKSIPKIGASTQAVRKEFSADKV